MYDHMFGVFLEYELQDVFRVLVQLDAEELELTDTVVFSFDVGFFQLHVDVHKKFLRRMCSANDIVIEGDYHDQTGVQLRTFGIISHPFRVGAIHVIFEVIDVQQYPVGIFLATEQRKLALGINFHLDDVEVGVPEMLWTYVCGLVPNSRSIVVKRYYNQDPRL